MAAFTKERPDYSGPISASTVAGSSRTLCGVDTFPLNNVEDAVKSAVLVDQMQIIMKLRGHCNAVYCAIFDGTGRYVITGSDDRLVKLWLAETGLCLRSCRGHEGDIIDLAVSNRNKYVASASNDFVIRVVSAGSFKLLANTMLNICPCNFCELDFQS